jgi:hypothetical protein
MHGKEKEEAPLRTLEESLPAFVLAAYIFRLREACLSPLGKFTFSSAGAHRKLGRSSLPERRF